MVRFLIFSCIYFASIAHSVPYTRSLAPRDTDTDIQSSSAANDVQAINATVMDHAGRDITSAFDVMVFYDSSAPSNTTIDTNDTQPAKNGTQNLLDRRQHLFYRQMVHCTTPAAKFISSECSHEDNKPGTLQEYTIICHRNQDMFDPYTGKFLYTSIFPVLRSGHCGRDEICINGGIPHNGRDVINNPTGKFAYCVQRSAFTRMPSKSPLGLNLNKEALVAELEGKRLSMVVSKPDFRTPLEVDKFDVEAEVAGNSDPEKSGAIDSCRDCMELETQQFKEGTESLKAEVRMLTTGAVAGVLFLAIMSG